MNCVNSECGENTIVSSITPAGMVRFCCKCNARVMAQQPAPVAQPVATKLPPAARAEALTPARTGSLLQQMRARVTELDREIKRLNRLQCERDELKRLLAAAKKPDGGAVVRPLRKQG